MSHTVAEKQSHDPWVSRVYIIKRSCGVRAAMRWLGNMPLTLAPRAALAPRRWNLYQMSPSGEVRARGARGARDLC